MKKEHIRKIRLIAPALLAAFCLAAAGCNGGNGGDQDVTQDLDDATDTAQEDAQPDVPVDPTPDDTPVDPVQDEVADEEVQTDPEDEDASEDPVEDEEPMDIGGDGDVVEDITEVTDMEKEEGPSPACEEAGGSCTEQRWILCGTGLEPITTDPHRDCGCGWCCVDAPASICSDSFSGNCVVGAECESIDGGECGSCWGSPSGEYSCEEGRVCCEDICG